MLVELVHVVTRDGVRLDGALSRAGETSRAGVDLVVFLHGLGSNFYVSPMQEAMAERLSEQGCSSLRVNSRGHDYAYASARGPLGSSYEIVDDCRADWRAWLDFAQAEGFRRIALWGHSLGAVKVIYYLATEHDPRVALALASSPPRFHYDDLVSFEGAAARSASFARAEQLVADGRPEALVAFDLAASSQFSASSLLDKYGAEDRYDYVRYLPEVTVPLFLTLGGLEGGVAFDVLAKEGSELAAAHEQVTFALIDGADHSYVSKSAELWACAHAWMQSCS